MQFKAEMKGHCRQADARLGDEGEGDDGSVAYVGLTWHRLGIRK
jgi:hypothetical protein